MSSHEHLGLESFIITNSEVVRLLRYLGYPLSQSDGALHLCQRQHPRKHITTLEATRGGALSARLIFRGGERSSHGYCQWKLESREDDWQNGQR